MMQKILLFNALPLVIFLNFSPVAFSQQADSTKADMPIG